MQNAKMAESRNSCTRVHVRCKFLTYSTVTQCSKTSRYTSYIKILFSITNCYSVFIKFQRKKVLLMIEVCTRFNSPNIFCAPAWSVTTSRNFIRNKNANCGEKHGKKRMPQNKLHLLDVSCKLFSQHAFYRLSLRLTCYQATTAKGKSI